MTPSPLLERTVSVAEMDGMLDLLHVVEGEETALHVQNGMSSFTFFLGLANLLISAFLIGSRPENFWIVYAAQSFLIIGYRIWREWKRGKGTEKSPVILWYFLDFCWVTNVFFAMLSVVVLIEVLDDALVSSFPRLVEDHPWMRPPELNFATQHPDIGRIFCLMATGPLGWSVIALNCKLVLHDISNYSSTFIHLWPVLTTLSVRWDGGQRVMAAYPGHFESLVGFRGDKEAPTVPELVLLASRAYLVWWAGFTAWMLLHGRLQSPQKTGNDTVYLSLVRTMKPVRKLCGVRSPPPPSSPPSSAEEDFLRDARSPFAVIKYMIFHAVIVHLSFIASALCYNNVGLHTAFAVLCTAYSIYLAASWYDYALTRKFSSKLRKKIRSLHPDKEKARAL